MGEVASGSGYSEDPSRSTGGSDLSRKAETLAHFKGRIDKLLRELDESPASMSKIGDQTITRAAYGTGFGAAEDLAAMYEKVHARLEKFSTTLGEQLEALGIAVQIADRGYDGIDAEQASRLAAIQKRTREYYPQPHEKPAPGGSDSPAPGDGTTGGPY